MLVANWDLGKGESAIIGWVLANPGFEAVLDDRAARRCAKVLGIPICGTLGVLLVARQNALIANLGEMIARLQGEGFYISEPLILAALRSAGE